MRVTNLDPVHSCHLFSGLGKDIQLIAELPPLGEWEGESDADTFYWADTTLVEFEAEA